MSMDPNEIKYLLAVQQGIIQTDDLVQNDGESNSTVTLANGSMINLIPGVSLIAVNPTSAVTGIILQQGDIGGHEITIVNEATAANSVTFATTGSNVADGSSDVINGNTARKFVWDANTALWYRIQ